MHKIGYIINKLKISIKIISNAISKKLIEWSFCMLIVPQYCFIFPAFLKRNSQTRIFFGKSQNYYFKGISIRKFTIKL